MTLRLPSAFVLRCAGYLTGRSVLKSRMFALFTVYGVMLMFLVMVRLLAFRGFTSFPRLAKYMMLRFTVCTLIRTVLVDREVLMTNSVLVVRVTVVMCVTLIVPLAIPEVRAIIMVCAFGAINCLSLLQLSVLPVL